MYKIIIKETLVNTLLKASNKTEQDITLTKPEGTKGVVMVTIPKATGFEILADMMYYQVMEADDQTKKEIDVLVKAIKESF